MVNGEYWDKTSDVKDKYEKWLSKVSSTFTIHYSLFTSPSPHVSFWIKASKLLIPVTFSVVKPSA
jgi:hypothetical protein